jgi:hypothetical protein
MAGVAIRGGGDEADSLVARPYRLVEAGAGVRGQRRVPTNEAGLFSRS